MSRASPGHMSTAGSLVRDEQYMERNVGRFDSGSMEIQRRFVFRGLDMILDLAAQKCQLYP